MIATKLFFVKVLVQILKRCSDYHITTDMLKHDILLAIFYSNDKINNESNVANFFTLIVHFLKSILAENCA